MMSGYNYHPTTEQLEPMDTSYDAEFPTGKAHDDSPRCIGAVNKFGSSQVAYASKESTSVANKNDEEETPAEVAALLASISSIASREIKDDSSMMKELAEIAFPDLSPAVSTDEVGHALSGCDMQPEELMHWQYCHGPAAVKPIKHRHRHYRGEERKERAVSMDSPDRMTEGLYAAEEPAVPMFQWRTVNSSSSYDNEDKDVEGGIFTTPPHSPAGKNHSMFGTVPNSEYRRSNHHSHDVPFKKANIAENVKTRYNRPRAVSAVEHKSHGNPKQKKEARRRHASFGNAMDLQWNNHDGVEDKPMKLILRKKFSWKNYPELEEFLIANREEYLRHSTLNYTMQQKKYNNTLTQRLIELAATHGYQFDPQDFSFVTVRDRIRCYFKSYVQSMKKRGVVIGYAARKAGLVTEEELEASAMTSGKIYVPNHEMEWERDDV